MQPGGRLIWTWPGTWLETAAAEAMAEMARVVMAMNCIFAVVILGVWFGKMGCLFDVKMWLFDDEFRNWQLGLLKYLRRHTMEASDFCCQDVMMLRIVATNSALTCRASCRPTCVGPLRSYMRIVFEDGRCWSYKVTNGLFLQEHHPLVSQS